MPTAGFTLVELLVGVTLAAAVMAAVLSSYIYLARSLGRLANQQTLETESRRTLAYFAKDVQSASAISGTPGASTVALIVPTAAGTNTVTYYYNANAYDAATPTDDVTVNGVTVPIQRQALTRCVYDGTSVSSLTLLRNITDNDDSTTSDLFIRYFDGSGNPYDNGSTPYTTVNTGALGGIKLLSLQFSMQLGAAGNGTQTLVYPVASGRQVMRNKAVLR